MRTAERRLKRAWRGARRTALLFLALLAVFFQFPFGVFAADIDIFTSMIAETGTVLENGGSFAVFYNEGLAAGEAAVVRNLTIPVDLYYTDLLKMDYSIVNETPAARAAVTVSVTLYFTDGALATFSDECDGEGSGTLEMPLENISGTMQLSDVRISALLPEGCVARISPITVEKETSADFAERFLCGEFTAYRGAVALSDGGEVLEVSFYGSAGYIEGEVAAKLENAGVNALRLSVLSASRTMEFAVYYSYGEDFTEENCVTFEIQRASEQKAYIIPLPDANRVRKLRIAPKTTGLTSLSVSSLLAVSAYADSTEYLGNVERCNLQKDKKTVVLRGTIPTATVALYRDWQLAVFSESVDGIRSAEPIKTAAISARFEINVPAAEGDISGTKYLVALINGEGELLPVAPAKFPLPYETAKAEELSFKGLVGDGCIDIGAGAAITDVDLSTLFDARNSGYAYRFEGEYFYFSREEADRLKAEITRYDAVGCKIIIRLTCSNPEREVPFTYSYNESGVFGYALNAETAEGRKYIRAAISYLSTALAGSDYSVYGFILGKNIESSGEYNFMGADFPLDSYAKNYLLALRTVYAAAKEYNGAARVFIGLGDDWGNESVGRKFLFPDYDAFLLLESLAGRAAAEGGVEFSVISESAEAPDFSKGSELFGGTDVFPFLSTLAESFGTVSARPVFVWKASGKTACAAYAYLYYSARFDGAEAFFVDLLGVGKLTDTASLVKLAKSIDTVKTLVDSAPYLAELGITAEKLEGYAPEKLVLRDLISEKLSLSSPITPLGSVIFRDYTKKSDTPDMVRCKDCEVVGYGAEYALCRFSAQNVPDCSAVIHLDGTNELSIADVLFFDVKLDCESAQTLTISICGGGKEREFTAELSSGSYRLYTDCGIPEGEGEYISFSLSGEGYLYVYRIGGESATKFDTRLSALLHESRGSARPIDDNAERNWGIFIFILIAISSATAVMMRRTVAQMKESEKDKKETEDEWKL